MKWTAMGTNWFVGFGEVRNGKAYLVQEKEPLLCPRVFALYLPSNGFIQADDRSAEFVLRGNLFAGPSPKTLPPSAIMFVPATWSLPTKPEQVADFLLKGTQKFEVDILKNPSYFVQKAKTFVDDSLIGKKRVQELKVPELAFKLKTNPASLSREFKTQAGISLLEYHELVQKTAHKFADLAEGEVRLIQSKDFSLLNAQLVE